MFKNLFIEDDVAGQMLESATAVTANQSLHDIIIIYCLKLTCVNPTPQSWHLYGFSDKCLASWNINDPF